MFAFAKQIEIEILQLRREAIGIVGNMFVIVGIAPDQPVALWNLVGLTLPFEKIGIWNAL